MADQVFQIGDTVRLKSGGPIMTVSATATNGNCACVYYEDGKFYGLDNSTIINQALLDKMRFEPRAGGWTIAN